MPQPYIQTYTGKLFTPYDPNPDDIDINDIAHSLSLINRFNGHTKIPYSVAEHSLWVSRHCKSNSVALLGLLHDASEAYLGDIARPLKTYEYRAAERWLQECILRKFGLHYNKNYNKESWEEVKQLDNWALWLEEKAFMDHVTDDIEEFRNYFDYTSLKQRPWQETKEEFLQTFDRLMYANL